jgi:hypothetical protein
MKALYKSIIGTIILIVFCGTCFCQSINDSLLNKSGIYLTIEDFLSRKLSHEIDCTKEKEKIRMHDWFSKPYLDFIYDGEKHTYKKGDVFGIRDCDNETYRFYDNKEYRIVEIASICIYVREHDITEGRAAGIEAFYFFFFSTKPGGKIYDLTISNIKMILPDNQKLNDELETECSRYKECSDEDIVTYDNLHKMYKINYLLSQLR